MNHIFLIWQRKLPAVVWLSFLSIGSGVGIALLVTRAGISDVWLAVAGLVLAVFICNLLVLTSPDLFNIFQLRLPGVFLCTYFVFIAVPSLFIFLGKLGSARVNFYLSMLSILIIFPLGVLFAQYGFPGYGRLKSSFEFGDYPRTVFDSLPRERTLKVFWVVAFGGALVIVLTYMAVVQRVPLVELFSLPGDYQTLTYLREESFKLLPNSVLRYVFSWARIFFLPYLALVTSIISLSRPKDNSWRIRAGISFAIAVLFAGASIAKAPVMYVVVMFLGLTYMMRRSRRSILRIVVGIILAISIPVAVVQLVYGNTISTFVALQTVLGRTFYTTVNVPYYYFLIFPNIVPFQSGQTVRLLTTVLSGLLDVQYFNAARYVYAIIFPKGIATGLANAVFVAYLWADFGWPGVILGTFLLGAFVQSIQYYLQARLSIWTAAFHFYLLVPIGLSLLSVSFPAVLLTNGVMIGFITTVLLNGIGRPVPLLLERSSPSSP